MRTLLALALLLPAAGCRQDATPPAASNEAVEEGFVSVFNGRDLAGWTGALDGYAVEDGLLVCRKDAGGNLYIDRPFGDFEFRFEFLLEPGGNNGLGIRAEQGKDAAYYGMELQILDDTAEEYAELEPYQYHGSIYGVAPAERGHLRPVGQWNEQTVIAHGTRITVILNGTTIVDYDIEHARTGTADGREHPGLFNPTGYIGFLGHGHRVAFRNLRIREL